MRVALVLVLAGFWAPSVEGADDKEKAELKKLEGTWALVSEERNGEKRVPPKSLWIIEGEAAKVYFEPAPPNAPKNWSPSVKPINVMQMYHFKLDPTQTPKALDQTTEFRDRKTLEFGQQKTPTKPENLTKPKLAIYKLDGDTLTICYAGYYDKGKRPGDFTAAKKSDRVIYVLQREKKYGPNPKRRRSPLTQFGMRWGPSDNQTRKRKQMPSASVSSTEAPKSHVRFFGVSRSERLKRRNWLAVAAQIVRTPEKAAYRRKWAIT